MCRIQGTPTKRHFITEHLLSWLCIHSSSYYPLWMAGLPLAFMFVGPLFQVLLIARRRKLYKIQMGLYALNSSDPPSRLWQLPSSCSAKSILFCYRMNEHLGFPKAGRIKEFPQTGKLDASHRASGQVSSTCHTILVSS